MAQEGRFELLMDLVIQTNEAAVQMQNALEPLVELTKKKHKVSIEFPSNVTSLRKSVQGLLRDIEKVNTALDKARTGAGAAKATVATAGGGRGLPGGKVRADVDAKTIEQAVAAGVQRALIRASGGAVVAGGSSGGSRGARKPSWTQAAEAYALAGATSSYGQPRFRDGEAERFAAIKRLSEERVKLEKQRRALQLAGSMEEQAVEAKKLKTAERRLRLAQEEVRVRMLSPSMAIQHQEATRTVRREFLPGYNHAIERGFQGDLNQFVSGVMGGDEGLGRSFLAARNVQSDILNDSVRLRSSLAEATGPLAQQTRIWREGNKEVERQVLLLQRQNEHTKFQEELIRRINRASRNVGQATPIALADGSGAGFGAGMLGGMAAKGNTEMGKFMRGLSYRVGGWGVGMMAAFQLRDSLRRNVELEQEMAQLQGIIGGQNKAQGAMLQSGVRLTARQYGADLLETARAAKVLAQTGLDVQETLAELDASMMAMRGMGMTVEQAQELAIAVRAIKGEAATLHDTFSVLSKIAAVEADYAVTSKDLADSITLVAPVIQQFMGDMGGLNDVFSQTIGLTTVLVEQLRVTGKEAGNALKFIMARLLQPHILRGLQRDFGLQLGKEGGADFLDAPDLLGVIAERYQQLNAAGKGGEAKQLAVLVAGGRRVNAIIPILEKYNRAQRIAMESALGFGDAQRRTDIALDTLGTRLARLKVSFDSFIGSLINSEGAATSLKVAISGLSTVLGGLSGEGGGIYSAGALAIGGLAAARGVGRARRAINSAQAARMGATQSAMAGSSAAMPFVISSASQAPMPVGRAASSMGNAGSFVALGAPQVARTAAGVGAVRGAVGLASSVLGPTAVLIGSFMAISAAADIAAWAWRKFNEQTEVLGDLDISREDILKAPQYAEGARLAEDYGLSAMELSRMVASASASLSPSLLDQYGVSSWQEMNDRLNEIGANDALRNLRSEISDGLIASLEDAIPKLRELETEQQKVASAASLIGYAAWDTNALIQASIDKLSDLNKTQLGKISEAVNALDSSGKNPLAKAWASFKADLSGIKLLDDKIRVGGSDTEFIRNRSATVASDAFQRVFGDNAIGRGIGEAIGDSLMERVVSRANEVGRAGKHGTEVTTTELLNLTLSELRADQEQYAGLISKVAGERLRELDADGTIQGLSSASERVGGAGNLGSKQALQDNFALVFSDIAREMQKQFAEAAGEANPLAKIMAGILEAFPHHNSVERSAVAIKDFSEAMLRMKGIVEGVLLSFHASTKEIEARSSLAAATSRYYDPRDDSMAALEKLYIGLQTAPTEMSHLIADLQRQLINAGQVASGEAIEKLAARRETMDDDEASAQFAAEFGKQGEAIRQRLDAYIQTRTEIVQAGTDLLRYIHDDTIQDEIRGALSLVERGEASDLSGLSNAAAGALGEAHQEKQAEARRIQSLDLAIRKQEQLRDLALLRVRSEAGIVEQIRAQEAADRALLKSRIELESSKPGQDPDELSRRIEGWRIEQEITDEIRRQRAVIEAQNALREQALANMRQGLSGLESTIRDLDFWGQIAKGEKGLGDVAANILGPLGQMFHDRLTENLMGSVMEVMSQSAFMEEIFGTPEIRMKNGIVEASTLAAELVKTAIIEGHTIGLASGQGLGMTSAIGGLLSGGEPFEGRGIGLAGTADGTSTDFLLGGRKFSDYVGLNATVAGAQPKTPGGASAKAQLGTSLAALAGNIGGTMLGGGNQGAQTGSSIGSTAGMLIGSVIPGVGTAIGGILGGLAGGALGGLFGKKKEDEPVLKNLAAIERAQRETIHTIERQTDALRDPSDMLLNLPSSFRVPGYMPTLGGSGAGEASAGATQNVVNGGVQVSVVLPAGNYDADEIAGAVERAIANSLSNDRSTRTRSIDRRGR